MVHNKSKTEGYIVLKRSSLDHKNAYDLDIRFYNVKINLMIQTNTEGNGFKVAETNILNYQVQGSEVYSSFFSFVCLFDLIIYVSVKQERVFLD